MQVKDDIEDEMKQKIKAMIRTHTHNLQFH